MINRRAIEFTVLFVILPVAIAVAPARYASPIPILWVGAIAALLFLRQEQNLDRSTLWGLGGVLPGLPGVLLRFACLGPLLLGFAWLMEPEHLFSLPRDEPRIWITILIAYPLLSVIPQGIVYRTFFCHRYRDLFGNGVSMTLVAAACFAFAHVVMHRWEPVLITLVGGIIFTSTLLRRRSGLLADVEHALYGDLAFTLGLGVWIYTDAARQGL